MQVQVHVYTCVRLGAPLTHTWEAFHSHDPVSSRMHAKGAFGSRGWAGTVPSSLIPPAKCKHMMAKGRQLPACVWLAPMQCKLLSLWGAKCVSMRYGDTYNCCVEILSALSLSPPPPSFPLSDLLLPDATVSCSLYFPSWIPFIWSFTFVDGIFPEVKERKLCPWLWEKEKESINLTPRPYSPRAPVFDRTSWRHDRICEWEYQHWEEHCRALVCNYCLTINIPGSCSPKINSSDVPDRVRFQIAEDFFRQH